MGFDDDYKREVLEPAREAGDQPPEDLRVRYRLREPLVPAQVAEQVRLVRQCWRRARGQLKYRKLIDRLEAEHRQLAPLFAAAERGDVRPLAERLRGSRERSAQRLADARARLTDAAGEVRMVTPAEVEELARAAGIAPGELESVAKVERIEIRDPDRLPASPPYAGYRKVRESLDVLGHRHLAEFLFGDALGGPMRVLEGFAAPGVPPGPQALAQAVQQAAEQWARRARDSSSTHAGTVLVALREAPPDALICYDLTERLRERHRQRASQGALLRHAVQDLGIEPADARRLVFAVLREDGPGGGVAARLRALLDAGEVYAAALLGEKLAGSELPEEAELLAEEARQRVAAAVRLREAATAETDADRAWRMLADALALVRDLPGAAEHQRRLPPRPVPRLRAVAEGTGVRLDWAPSPSAVGEITYRVVRCQGRPPGGDGDGETVAAVAEATGAFDADPPVNVPLYYGVVARRGAADAPITCADPVVVRPEVQSLELVAGDGVVTGRWIAPPGAARIVVLREGRPVAAERDGFREQVPNGVPCHYRIAAVYLDGEGRETMTPGVTASVTPNAPPEPVREWTVETDPADPARTLLCFPHPPGGTVEILMLEAPPPWPVGTLLPAAKALQAGRRVPAAPTSRGLMLRPDGGGWLLAVTVSGDLAAIGACHRHVNLPPPAALVAERRGERVHVGFDWPEEVAEVELTYRVGASAPREERLTVTRAAYESGGGIHLPVPADQPVTVAVAAAGMRQGARVVGPAAQTTLPARRRVRYDLRRSGPPWRRSLTVRLSAPHPLQVARLTLVHRDGQVEPQRPEDGRVLGTWEQVPVPGELSVPAPGGSGPYWLRCFADDESIELIDPPVRSRQTLR
ncbi:hypothetical protein [Thermomonospora curvata]|uniref:Fibronectin type-III domain-containing protein n=1 Tax=Thermomonospora curvata (strain ATCC 19995 / DSM 43183 / JCM 3096 / KCTC 9072 / NBRC 15933 / NCIMB 10081 / Henssen B9) TaxID=471852 RepID=D1ACV6_THECD|nr:hypothetical protein [Thermomonospora curvata]ACY97445.1 hypothetical protein Tcur_1872 [Thermomonospora curvata DSM 43183]